MSTKNKLLKVINNIYDNKFIIFHYNTLFAAVTQKKLTSQLPVFANKNQQVYDCFIP